MNVPGIQDHIWTGQGRIGPLESCQQFPLTTLFSIFEGKDRQSTRRSWSGQYQMWVHSVCVESEAWRSDARYRFHRWDRWRLYGRPNHQRALAKPYHVRGSSICMPLLSHEPHRISNSIRIHHSNQHSCEIQLIFERKLQTFPHRMLDSRWIRMFARCHPLPLPSPSLHRITASIVIANAITHPLIPIDA